MKGRIYSGQRCPICRSLFYHDENRDGLWCKSHPEIGATGDFIVRFGREVTKRFKSYRQASRFLTGLRYETDKGYFDPRDYKKDQPLGFESLAERWLKLKKTKLKPKSYANLERYMARAMEVWGQTNIKLLEYADIEDFLFTQTDISEKTRANMKSCLHDFWIWLKKRKLITLHQFPEFPEVPFELGFRNIIDKETQKAIINKIYDLTYASNPKIWLGVKWLATYIAIRPGELLKLRECDINTRLGYFIIPHPKEKRPKMVPILPEDVTLIDALPKGMPQLPFFRHEKGISGVKAGRKFGDKYLYKNWKAACKTLGIENVDLYGGTRHSSATDLRRFLSPEQIKAGSLHRTNKAFERYLQASAVDALDVYRKALPTDDVSAEIVPIHNAK